ncbi:MAG: hypothetical protein LBK66_07245 [Spirochaetaceae bacterium]|jgi:hypothetical protein|nr:hypothetical protein [Spirochaetaceae bacterium]
MAVMTNAFEKASAEIRARVKNLAAYKTTVLILLYAAFAGAPLAAQYRGISLGLGGEVNAVSLVEGGGYGAAFAVESRLNRLFALSFQGYWSLQNGSTLTDLFNKTAFTGIEASTFLRFYFVSPKEMRPGGIELFMGAGVGVLAVMNGSDVHDTRGHPEISAILGARFRLGSRFYLEPYARGGFPFIGGVGIMFGLRFPDPNDDGLFKAEGTEDILYYPSNGGLLKPEETAEISDYPSDDGPLKPEETAEISDYPGDDGLLKPEETAEILDYPK